MVLSRKMWVHLKISPPFSDLSNLLVVDNSKDFCLQNPACLLTSVE